MRKEKGDEEGGMCGRRKRGEKEKLDVWKEEEVGSKGSREE